MNILLFGKNGQVGWELNRSLLPLGEVVALGRNEADFSKPESLRKIVRDMRPDVIVNAAAYTAVDKAESEEALATVINGDAPGVLAEEARRIGSLLVHYSTDYIFDGTKSAPYSESDTPNPLNAYGRSKLAGEIRIRECGCDYMVLRTSWVYSARGSNFLLTILRLATEREELKIINDQFGSPTWARNIADVTAQILPAASRERAAGAFVSGTYPVCASGKTTWHGFSSAIISSSKMSPKMDNIKTERCLPIKTEDYPLPARRPKNSELELSTLVERFGLVMPEWRDAMELCLEEVMSA